MHIISYETPQKQSCDARLDLPAALDLAYRTVSTTDGLAGRNASDARSPRALIV